MIIGIMIITYYFIRNNKVRKKKYVLDTCKRDVKRG